VKTADDIRETILNTLDDLVADFLYYDRKESENSPKGTIERAVHEGIVSIDEMVVAFGIFLRKGIRNGE
jgi:hypothetical protein